MRNPYQPRGPLSDPACFYGRQQDLKRVFGYLNGPHPLPVSLTGQRLIGKTWLLQRIYRDGDLQKEMLDAPDTYVFVYWDLQRDGPGRGQENAAAWFFSRLFDLLLERLTRETAAQCRTLRDPGDSPYEAFREIVEYLALDRRIIFLLDAFDVLAGKAFLEGGFASQIRGLLGIDGVGMVVASVQPLQEVVRASADSSLFNSFNTLWLGPLSDDEARAFVEVPSAMAGYDVSPDAVDVILELAGPHPCFLSRFCFDLLHESTDHRVTQEEARKHGPAFRSAISADLDHYWEHLDEDQKALLTELANGNTVTNTANRVYRQLSELSLVVERGGRPAVLCAALRDNIRAARAEDIYFQKTFSDHTMSSPPFQRLLEVMLTSATHIPEDWRKVLKDAIAKVSSSSREAILASGRDMLEQHLLEILCGVANIPSNPNATLHVRIAALGEAFRDRRLPRAYEAHLHRLRYSGNAGGHGHVPPALAFLTIAEAIYLLDDVTTRFPKKRQSRL